MPDLLDNTKKPDENNVQEGHVVGLFHSFCEYPKGVSFQNQEEDEQIVLFLRQHISTNIPWIIITLLLLITPLVVWPLFAELAIVPFELPTNLPLILFLFYYLLVFGYAFINFLHWFYNIGIVTQKNIIDIDYTEIVNVHVAATKVGQVEDVSYKQSGFLRTFFNFGDVFIQTAGHLLNFEFLRVPKPDKVADIVHDRIGKRNHV